MITGLRWKLTLLLLLVGISSSGVVSAADAPSVPDDPCFIPPMLKRSLPEFNGPARSGEDRDLAHRCG